MTVAITATALSQSEFLEELFQLEAGYSESGASMDTEYEEYFEGVHAEFEHKHNVSLVF